MGLKKLLCGIILSVSLISSLSTLTTSAEELYDIGRVYNEYIYDGTDVRTYNGYSVIVMSVASKYYYGEGFGRERLRVWSRLETMKKLYPDWSPWVSKTVHQFSSNNNDMILTGSDPGHNLSSTDLPPVLYDLLAYKGIPTDTIKAYVNNSTIKGTGKVENTGYDWSLTTHRPQHSVVDLPLSISYKDADEKVSNTYSGINVKFNYSLPGYLTNYPVHTKSKIEYGLTYKYGGVYYVWTGDAKLDHDVNRK
jgi:hypothetical protein